jgi:hypothetical protein
MKKKMATVHSDLLRKFTDIAFDESAQVRWEESQREKADDTGGEPEVDLQSHFIGVGGNPI